MEKIPVSQYTLSLFMETVLYLVTAVLAVAWSVYAYLSWSDRAHLAEYAGGGFFLIIGPSGYFLLLALAGWQRAPAIRLDLIGIVTYDGLILLCWLGLLLLRALRVGDPKRTFAGFLVTFNVLSILLVIGVYLVRFFPPLLIRLAGLASQGLRMDFFRFAWVGLNPETNERDLVSMANKVLIAMLTYIPISLVRSIFVNRQISRQRRQMIQEIEELKRRIRELEKLVMEKAKSAAG